MRAGQYDLGPLGCLLDLHHVRPNHMPLTEAVDRRLFTRRKNPLRLAEIHDDRFFLDPVDASRNNVPLLMAVFRKNGIPLGFPELLDDDLFGRLGRDASEPGVIDLFAFT
ncbi:MAG: hypothetical protein BWY44_01577 [Candidatus Omnitrophica bacterium ADurb.Bin292]|nr:MAG: hypothetical protein BWY44_01577 [Candidatus Omnitrophica bacterium ADurb.Bin292]